MKKRVPKARAGSAKTKAPVKKKAAEKRAPSSSVLQIRLTAQEKTVISKAAKEAHLKVAPWARAALFRQAENELEKHAPMAQASMAMVPTVTSDFGKLPPKPAAVAADATYPCGTCGGAIYPTNFGHAPGCPEASAPHIVGNPAPQPVMVEIPTSSEQQWKREVTPEGVKLVPVPAYAVPPFNQQPE